MKPGDLVKVKGGFYGAANGPILGLVTAKKWDSNYRERTWVVNSGAHYGELCVTLDNLELVNASR